MPEIHSHVAGTLSYQFQHCFLIASSFGGSSVEERFTFCSSPPPGIVILYPDHLGDIRLFFCQCFFCSPVGSRFKEIVSEDTR